MTIERIKWLIDLMTFIYMEQAVPVYIFYMIN